jgi:hypothetical protein
MREVYRMPTLRLHLTASRFLLTALALSTLVLTSACSMVRVGYNQLDTIAAWMADDYFDLDPQQRHQFSARFQRLHEWHRYEQLPEYAAFLGETRRRLQRGLERDDVVWVIDGVRARYRTIARRGAEDAAALLATVAPAQLDALRRQWDKDNTRYVRDYALDGANEDRRRARLRRSIDRIRDWTGSITREQEARIAAMIEAMPDVAQLRHEDRIRRQREFLSLMALRGDPAVFASRVRHWLLDWEEGRDPEYDRRYRQWLEMRVQMMVAVDRMLTPEQRANVVARLQRHIEDFRTLSQRADVRAAAD